MEQAVELLKQREFKVMAGGTDLLVSIKNGVIKPQAVVDIKGLEELKVLDGYHEGLRIGAAVTINELIESEEVQGRFPILTDAGRVLASYQVRNRATVGGNLCNASPAADMAPPLLALGASVEIHGSNGMREIPLEKLFTGVKRTSLNKDEILAGIKVPLKSGKGKYIKKARIKGPDLSTVGVACFREGDIVRIAVGACAPTPVVVEVGLSGMTKERVIEESKMRVMDMLKPIDDVRASAEYRIALVQVFIERILREIL